MAAPSVKEELGDLRGHFAPAQLHKELCGAVGLHAAAAQDEPAREAARLGAERQRAAGPERVRRRGDLLADGRLVARVEDDLLIARLKKLDTPIL